MLKKKIRRFTSRCPHAMSQKIVTRKWRLANTLSVHKAPIHGIDIFASKNIVATASWDSKCQIYDLSTNQIINTIQNKVGMFSVAFCKTKQGLLATTVGIFFLNFVLFCALSLLLLMHISLQFVCRASP